MAMAMTVAAFAVYAAASFRGRDPRLLSESGDPARTAAAFMDALCAGDYETASSYLQGSPDLGLDTLPPGDSAAALTAAFRASWSWEPGEIWRKDAEARLPITFTALDPDRFAAGLDRKVQAILNGWLDSARHRDELYNADNTWREDAVLQALDAAVYNQLRDREQYESSVRLTLLLRWEDQRWVVVPDEMLYSVLAGEVSG